MSKDPTPPQARRPPKARTLEFDLGLAPTKTSRPARSQAKDKSPPLHPPSTQPPHFHARPRRTTNPPPAAESAPKSVPPPEPTQATATPIPTATGEPTMNQAQPAPLNVKKTIERQSREQNAMSHLLNGAAIAFLCTVLLIASLAGLGGYVLYKQLRNQSATIALLETNTLERFAELETRMAARNKELAELQHDANLRLTTLQGQFEQYRAQTTQSISLLTSANARLERRLAEYRQELLRQEQLVSMNETPIRRLR